MSVEERSGGAAGAGEPARSPFHDRLPIGARLPSTPQWGAPPPQQVIAHTNLYWQDTSAPGRQAAVVPADEVAFGD